MRQFTCQFMEQRKRRTFINRVFQNNIVNFLTVHIYSKRLQLKLKKDDIRLSCYVQFDLKLKCKLNYENIFWNIQLLIYVGLWLPEIQEYEMLKLSILTSKLLREKVFYYSLLQYYFRVVNYAYNLFDPNIVQKYSGKSVYVSSSCCHFL